MLVSLLLALGQVALSAPPEQPPTGPGGMEYAHAAVSKSFYADPAESRNPTAFWLFEPTQPPTDSAPVIVFFHGFGASDPDKYGAWIDHLVRRGRIVVYPLYQSTTDMLPNPRDFTETALASFRRALEVLANGRHVAPDLKRIAFAGHSIGGLVAVEAAARAAELGLSPKALFAVEPGAAITESFGTFPRGDLARIPKGTLLLTLAGDADSIAGDLEARRIYRATTSIPADDKDIVVLHSDDHGRPALSAHHLAALAVDGRFKPHEEYTANSQRKETDALDFYGPWKLFDALCDAGFDGVNREYALGNTPEQRFMGVWSDGQPVVELDVMDLE